MSETRRKGATKLILSTPKKTDPIPARRLYEKLGFREVAPNQDQRSFYMQYEYPEEK
jgi:ribosomal protein S18 acetylase RimI-like enzyme